MRQGTHHFKRSSTVEQLEDRLVMSADPLSGLLGGQIEHCAYADEAPQFDHQLVADELPALSNHLQREADFWIDSDRLRTIDQELQRVEQSLANAHDQSGLTQVRTDYGFDGTGQTVAIIDSGIAYDHFALGGGFGANYRVVGGWDFTGENDGDPYDDGPSGSHGTHVAGIVGASGGTHTGVAPGVDLVSLRVFDDAGDGYFSWVENALQWIHNNRNSFENPITTVNLSLGVATWNADSIPSWANLEDEFSQLEQDGIFISVSAGNSYTSYNTAGLSYPAASPYVIPVASVDDNGLLSYYSQRNSRVIAAPGRGIISTVPDYAGNNDSIANDYASFSGTSMAAPYVAGASVIIREAMEFVGYTNITQDTIYDHMIATADTFFDSATNANYSRLNLEAAIDALMPADDYGSSVAAAYQLGTLTSTPMSMNGAITTLTDADYFTFTAGSTGTVTFTASNMTHNVAANWSVTGGTGAWSGNLNEIVTIDVVAGQQYTVGFSSSGGLGFYDLDISTAAAFTYTDWGTISFSQLQGLAVSGETWYRVAANDAGYFTGEAFFNEANGQVSLELYNSQLQLVDSGNPSGGTARVDTYAAASDEFFLKVIGTNASVDFQLTNLVSLNGTTVTIDGTAGNDAFTFTAGTTHQLSVNGTSYSFAAIAVTDFNFDGSDGTDTLALTGTSGDETATFYPGSVTMTGSGFSVGAVNVEQLSAVGGGGDDRANFYDSSGDDRFIVRPTSAEMIGSGYYNFVTDFNTIYGYATAGGTDDRADFYDSAGNDRFFARPTYSYMSGAGYLNLASGFDRVYAYATAGGADDRADFWDSAGDDRFVGRSTYAQMSGAGFFNYASGFDRVYAYATAGGADDRADFYDSAGDDRFVGKSTYAQMSGTGYFNYSSGFDRVYAYATAGGADDRADFYDSAGNDRFVARSTYSQMSGTGYFVYGSGFDRTYAYATAGGADDRADFYDSAGDDRFVSKPTYSQMSGTVYFNYGMGFDRVYAYAIAGGADDRADFYDSAGNDRFVAKSTFSQMSGTGFFNYGVGFDRVYGYATAGGTDDRADFWDSAGDDRFVARPTYSQMSGSGFFTYGAGFDRVYAYANAGGNDRADFFDSAGNDRFIRKSDYSQMSGNGYFNYGVGFDRIYGYATAGGTDRADFYDSTGNDSLYADDNYTAMSGVDFYMHLIGFAQQTAYSMNGGVDTSDVNVLDSAFTEIGDWNV